MNRAEKILLDNIREIQGEGSWDRDPRPKYSDGVPAHTKFITDVFEKYEADDVPITESRRIAWKSSIRELLAIYQTQTNTQEGFESHKVNWWESWMNEEGNIGRAYSYNLESHRPNEMTKNIVKVKKRYIDPKEGQIKNEVLQSVDFSKSIDGKIYFDRFIILDDKVYDDKRKRNKKKIQFIDTGYIKLVEDFTYKGGKTPYDRTYANIGYIGDLSKVNNFSEEHLEILKRRWISMLSRCYHNSTSHESYKNNETFVHQDWHSLEGFLRTIRLIPQYHLAKEANFEGWELDKDYFSSNCYSPKTCVWLKREENNLYKKSSKPFKLIKDKEEIVFLTTVDASKFLKCVPQSVDQSLKKGCKVKGYHSKYIEEDYFYRHELSRNQINELLNNLEETPYSRRHLVSFFNWANNDKKMLVECAYETMWTVREKDGETILDLHLNQRSSDYLTAGHINLVQYKALQMMVAKHLGYEVGTFSRHVMNMHIYDRHMVNIEPILSAINKIDKRGTRPEFILDVPDKTNFYDIKESDFIMENYHPYVHEPKLKFDLGI